MSRETHYKVESNISGQNSWWLEWKTSNLAGAYRVAAGVVDTGKRVRIREITYAKPDRVVEILEPKGEAPR